MQIPPNAALLNLVASLPAQGATATASTAAKAVPPAATPPAVTATLAGDDRPTLKPLPRGSILNIVA